MHKFLVLVIGLLSLCPMWSGEPSWAWWFKTTPQFTEGQKHFVRIYVAYLAALEGLHGYDLGTQERLRRKSLMQEERDKAIRKKDAEMTPAFERILKLLAETETAIEMAYGRVNGIDMTNDKNLKDKARRKHKENSEELIKLLSSWK